MLRHRNYTSIVNLYKTLDNIITEIEIQPELKAILSIYRCGTNKDKDILLAGYSSDMSQQEIDFLNGCCRDIPGIAYSLWYMPTNNILLTELCGSLVNPENVDRTQMLLTFLSLANKGVSHVDIAYISKAVYMDRYRIVQSSSIVELDTTTYYIITIRGITRNDDPKECAKAMISLYSRLFPKGITTSKTATALPLANKILGCVLSVPEIDVNHFFGTDNTAVYKKYVCLNNIYNTEEGNTLATKIRSNLSDNIGLQPVPEALTSPHFLILNSTDLCFNIIRNNLNTCGMRETAVGPEFVSFVWVDGKQPSAYGIRCDIKNKLDGHTIVTRKLNLYMNLFFYFPQVVQKYMAPTYMMDASTKISNDKVYIVRPVDSYAGNGITLVADESDVAYAYATARKFSKDVIISDYVTDVALWGPPGADEWGLPYGKKYHMRVYLLVSVMDGVMRSYILDLTKIMTAASRYDKTARRDAKDIADTHLKSTVGDIFAHMQNESPIFQSGIREIIESVSKLLGKTVGVFAESKNGFEVFALDILKLENETPVLLEVNDRVGYACNTGPLYAMEFSIQFFHLINETVIKPMYMGAQIPRAFYEQKLVHVLLEPLAYNHIDALEKISRDTETMRHIGVGKVWTSADIKDKIDSNRRDSGRYKKYYHYAVIDPATSSLVGYAGLHPMLNREGLQLRVFIDKNAQGRGFGSQAITQLLNMDIPYTIYGVTESNNSASKGMMEKAHLAVDTDMYIKGVKYLVFRQRIPGLNQKEDIPRGIHKPNAYSFNPEIGNYGNDYSLAKRELPDLVRNGKMPYPYLRLYTTPQEILTYFEMLKRVDYDEVSDDYTLYNIKIRHPVYSERGFIAPEDVLKIGEYRRSSRIVSGKSDVTTIGTISDYFSEPVRVHCKFLRNEPIINYYQSHIPEIVDDLRRYKLPINSMQLRESLWRSRNKQCTTFKPKLIKLCIGMFGEGGIYRDGQNTIKKVLDISAGWGDRLVGCMASNIDVYHAFDPNVAMQNAYQEIIEFLGPHAVNKKIQCRIEPLPFEDAPLQQNYYDLVMSSPPYFMMEIYSKDRTQSTSTAQSEREWYTKYLKRWIDKCYGALKSRGILCLNINQEQTNSYVNWLFKDLSDEYYNTGIGFSFFGTQGYVNEDGNNTQPIFIWKKI